MTSKKLYLGSAGLVCLVVAIVSFMFSQLGGQEAKHAGTSRTTRAEISNVPNGLKNPGAGNAIAEDRKRQAADLINPEPEKTTQTITELQNADVRFSSVSEVDAFITTMQERPYVALMPLVKELADNPELMEAWLSQLLLADEGEVPTGSEVVLANIPKQNFVSFLNKSLSYGGQDVRKSSISALSRRNDIDVVTEGLSSQLTSVVTSDSTQRYTKIDAMTALTNKPDSYSRAERAEVVSAVQKLTQNDDGHLRSKAITSMLKLNNENAQIEPAVMAEIGHRDTEVRKKALTRLDHWMELGIELSSSSVSLTQRQVVSDLSGTATFRKQEREAYVDTASYVLSRMDLSKSQIYNMESAGIPHQKNLSPRRNQENSRP